MNNLSKPFIFTLRVALGWLFFYAGITKVFNPEWSARGYLMGAKTLPQLYSFLASPNMLPVTNFLNQWGLTIIGISLLVGFLVKYTAPAGALMMILYYFPVLDFPMAGEHSYIVDEHIIYAAAFLVLWVTNAGTAWGVDAYFPKKK